MVYDISSSNVAISAEAGRADGDELFLSGSSTGILLLSL